MDEIVRLLGRYDTSTISDAMDKLGIAGTCFGVKPLSSSYKMIGRAFTVKYGSVGAERGTVGDYIDDVKPGEIVVLDNNGRLDCTVWGDILTSYSCQHKIGGTLINGVCRDTNRIFELNYPLFSMGSYMRTGKDRVKVDGINVDVSVANVRVCSGDIVIGDADGVVIIPRKYEQQILQFAREIELAEEKIRQAIQNGTRLVEARALFHYHDLQHK